MRPSTIARRYADAAFSVAQEDGDTSAWIKDLKTVADRMQDDNDVREYFRDPNYSHDEKLEALEVLFPNLQPHVLNLLRELVSRQRFGLVPQVLGEFARLEREARGVQDAYVSVARQVSEAERQSIASELGSSLGGKVEVHMNVDPSLLGGIIVRVGDQVYDASVATRLQRLRQELAI
jgi:F-type H+-transporting ATPase subunit delta